MITLTQPIVCLIVSRQLIANLSLTSCQPVFDQSQPISKQLAINCPPVADISADWSLIFRDSCRQPVADWSATEKCRFWLHSGCIGCSCFSVCSRYYPNMCEVNIIQNNILWGWGMWVLVKVLRLANGLWLNQFTGVENIVIFFHASAATSEAFLFNNTAIYNIFTWACISTDNIAWGLASHQYE